MRTLHLAVIVTLASALPLAPVDAAGSGAGAFLVQHAFAGPGGPTTCVQLAEVTLVESGPWSSALVVHAPVDAGPACADAALDRSTYFSGALGDSVTLTFSGAARTYEFRAVYPCGAWVCYDRLVVEIRPNPLASTLRQDGGYVGWPTYSVGTVSGAAVDASA